MSYLEEYLKKIEDNGNNTLAEAIKNTVKNIIPKYISDFSFRDHVVSLLVGDVQSGKTSHMFGVISASADEGFKIFILLTTDNILLQQQTFARAVRDLEGFCICGENDYLKFSENKMQKPVLIVLKKNARILRQWKNNLSSTNFCGGNPLFIVDDEADAASLNTLVNNKKQSTINKNLEAIKKTSASSIYLEVTGTPQAILLQTEKSGWKPYFIYYFEPGERYIGGNFFFTPEPPKSIVLTDNDEVVELISDDEFPENGLKDALINHLIVSAQIFITGGDVCNFLIHPSVKINLHSKFANKIGQYLNEIYHSHTEYETISAFRDSYSKIKDIKSNICDFERIYDFIIKKLSDCQINTYVLNSESPYDENTAYHKGINIIVGGNSLGRGVTFPKLQTIYYCRVSKSPQADTMWQHSRMFGYDRDPELMKVYMPPKLFKLFSDINQTNNNIIRQIQSGRNKINIFYPPTIKPTRRNVLDRRAVEIYSGGVNYFPFYPTNRSITDLDNLLSKFKDGLNFINLKLMVQILKETGSEGNDWIGNSFINIINGFIDIEPSKQGRIIVRRNRNIGKGTGTLLSPDDRALGDSIKDSVVLTMYKVTGNKGWEGKELWIPNIKLPENMVYYRETSSQE